MALTLFGDNVLIKPDPEETQTKGGIIIPDTAQHNNRKGTVIRIGDGTYDGRTGTFTPTTAKEGDRVIFANDAVIQQSHEWDNLLLMTEKDIVSIIK